MDKETEIKGLREELESINVKIKDELNKIEQLKSELARGYRHRDKTKYEAERREITANLDKYKIETDRISDILSALKGRGFLLR